MSEVSDRAARYLRLLPSLYGDEMNPQVYSAAYNLSCIEFLPAASVPVIAALVLIHGGGWVGGVDDNNLDSWIAQRLALSGVVVYSIDYRLDNQVAWPAMLQDTQTAIRWARSQTGNSIPVGALGTSAGGHIALMAGTQTTTLINQATDPNSEATSLHGYNSQPDFVVSISGPGDLVMLSRQLSPPNHNLNPYINKLIAGVPPGGIASMEALSPINLLSATMPPTFLLYGTGDLSVPIEQANELWTAFQAIRSGPDNLTVYTGMHILDGTTLTQRELYMAIIAGWVGGLK